MDKKELTAADIWAMFAETARRQENIARSQEESDRQRKENERLFKEWREEEKERHAERDRQRKEDECLLNKWWEEEKERRAERDRQRKEDERIWKEEIAERDRQRKEEECIWKEKSAEDDLKRKEEERIWKEEIAERDRQRKEEECIWKEKIAKTERLIDKIAVRTDDINYKVEGIGKSNGKFAEEYFYNSLERTLEFAGVHFDGISNKFGFMKKMPDGKRLKDQFDIVLLNGNSVAIIEIKYKADESDYPQKMVEKKIPNFKLLYPEYAKHKIYLGLGSMSFEDKVVSEAKKFGIGLLKQVGETIEYETEWIRAY